MSILTKKFELPKFKFSTSRWVGFFHFLLVIICSWTALFFIMILSALALLAGINIVSDIFGFYFANTWQTFASLSVAILLGTTAASIIIRHKISLSTSIKAVLRISSLWFIFANFLLLLHLYLDITPNYGTTGRELVPEQFFISSFLVFEFMIVSNIILRKNKI